MSSSAAYAVQRSSATTAATTSPTYRARSLTIGYQSTPFAPIAREFHDSGIGRISRTASSPVKMRITPGRAAAAATSMPRIRACAWGLRRNAIDAVLFSRMSLTNVPCPAASCVLVSPVTRRPMFFIAGLVSWEVGSCQARARRPPSPRRMHLSAIVCRGAVAPDRSCLHQAERSDLGVGGALDDVDERTHRERVVEGHRPRRLEALEDGRHEQDREEHVLVGCARPELG